MAVFSVSAKTTLVFWLGKGWSDDCQGQFGSLQSRHLKAKVRKEELLI